MGNILSAARMDGTAPATGGMGACLGMKAWHTIALPLDLLCSFVATNILLQQNNITKYVNLLICSSVNLLQQNDKITEPVEQIWVC